MKKNSKVLRELIMCLKMTMKKLIGVTGAIAPIHQAVTVTRQTVVLRAITALLQTGNFNTVYI
jgi:hypothetical protein